MTITWNTDVNALCCPGEIIDDGTGQTILIQTDWDYPGTASTFGWWLGYVQACHKCGERLDAPDDSASLLTCDGCGEEQQPCGHDGTDGTVDCPECGVTASDFIAAARDWLDNNDGVTADDPGYFSE